MRFLCKKQWFVSYEFDVITVNRTSITSFSFMPYRMFDADADSDVNGTADD
jgi:hypothetical protein